MQCLLISLINCVVLEGLGGVDGRGFWILAMEEWRSLILFGTRGEKEEGWVGLWRRLDVQWGVGSWSGQLPCRECIILLCERGQIIEYGIISVIISDRQVVAKALKARSRKQELQER